VTARFSRGPRTSARAPGSISIATAPVRSRSRLRRAVDDDARHVPGASHKRPPPRRAAHATIVTAPYGAPFAQLGVLAPRRSLVRRPRWRRLAARPRAARPSPRSTIRDNHVAVLGPSLGRYGRRAASSPLAGKLHITQSRSARAAERPPAPRPTSLPPASTVHEATTPLPAPPPARRRSPPRPSQARPSAAPPPARTTAAQAPASGRRLQPRAAPRRPGSSPTPRRALSRPDPRSGARPRPPRLSQ
jgi:hypothetical protein